MADPRSDPSMEDILASIKRIIADDKQMPLDRPPLPGLAPPPLSPPSYAGAPSTRPPAWPERPAPVSLDRLPPWPPRAEPTPSPESILELTDRAPEDMQPAAMPPEPVPPPLIPAQRTADRPRQPDISWTVPEEPAPAPPPAAAAPPPLAQPRRAAAPDPGSMPDIGSLIVNRTASGDNTIEGLVREMLRPMLRDWVDANLPAMVERLVQSEIKALMDREGGE